MTLLHQARIWPLVLAVAACRSETGSTSGTPAPELSAPEIAEYTRELSSDAYLGRGTGQPGGTMAAEYVSARFAEFGLEAPGGSHLQPFPIVGNSPDPASVSLSFIGPRASLTPTYLDDFVLNAGDAESSRAEGTAEVVFVGYGIDAPEEDWNDYAAVDVAGKYVLILVNDPPAPLDDPDLFGGAAMTYYGRWTYKYEEAARRGALGALVVHQTAAAGYPWSVVRGSFSGEGFSLPPDATAPSRPPLVGWVTERLARSLLATAGLDFDDLEARAGTRGFTAVETGVTVRARLDARVRRIETDNVAGLVRGSARPQEYVVVTAHYDHLGIGEPIDGDSVYNGAYDNASGTALLLAMAHAVAGMEPAPGRSILFLATGAEEQGLLGAEQYVRTPLFPLNRTAADLNFDGANLWGRTTDATVEGQERSELGAYVRRAADRMALTLVPDAEPEVGRFFRSDHFPFAKAGVPALSVGHGRAYAGRPAEWGDSIQADYTARSYHAPSDEFSEDFVFDGAVQQGTLGLLIVLDLAASDSWPEWHDGQEFRAARQAMMAGR